MKLPSIFRKKQIANSQDTQDIYTDIGSNIDLYEDAHTHSRMDKKYQLTEFFEIIKDIIFE